MEFAAATTTTDPEIAGNGIDPAIYERRWKTLGALCLALLIIIMGNTTLNVALPVLSQKLSATNSQLQWMVDAYSLVFAGLLFTAGNIGDRYGRKGILQGGLALFGVATAFAAFIADSASALIGARVVMGIAGAMVMPATLSIITNIFPKEERAKAVATWAAISGSGAAIGPLLSGFVLQHFSWNAVFAINVPFILVALFLVGFRVPRTKNDHHAPIDVPGALLSAIGISTIVYAIIEGPSHGWLAAQTVIVGAVGLVVMALFVAWEKRAADPMLDVDLFKVRAFGISSLALTLVFFSLMGIFFSMSQLLQLVYGYSPLNAAVRLSPIAGAMMIAAPQSARLAARFGKRKVVASGMWLVAGGVAIMTFIGVTPNYGLLILGLVVMASGMGIAMSPTTDLLMSAVPREKAGMGSAMNDTTRELGGSLGVAVFGSLLASKYSHQLSSALGGIPEAARKAAEGSLGGALQVASKMGADGRTIADAAKASWLSGFRFSLMIGAVVVATAGLVAWKFLPDTAADQDLIPVDTVESVDDDSDACGVALGLTVEDELALDAESYRPVLGD